jgi:hypothetical protein
MDRMIAAADTGLEMAAAALRHAWGARHPASPG